MHPLITMLLLLFSGLYLVLLLVEAIITRSGKRVLIEAILLCAFLLLLNQLTGFPELCEDMNMEDEILEKLATQERLIAYERAERRKAEAEKARLEKLLQQAGIEF
ncbi:MAG: hypothetical protein V8K32_03780 [Candidatus Electrothrix gigas]